MPQMSIIFLLLLTQMAHSVTIPLVVNTWRFTQATEKVWSLLKNTSLSALDAVTIGCATCEELQCDHTVGFGGSPDENGETTLDALIFDGATMDMGAVAALRQIKNAIGVARHILENTQHSFIAGDLATKFAQNFNFVVENLTTNYSENVWIQWKHNKCQPNFWKNVSPDPTKSCGPYNVELTNTIGQKSNYLFDSYNHDTIGMIVIDSRADIAAGTSTNGASHKIPGRVGDSPIPGAGAYADNEVGAAVATGDGDVMMRFLPSFLAVEEMRRGALPTKAAQVAVERIARRYPDFVGGVVAVNNKGMIGAACNGMDKFPYSLADPEVGRVVVREVECTNYKCGIP